MRSSILISFMLDAILRSLQTKKSSSRFLLSGVATLGQSFPTNSYLLRLLLSLANLISFFASSVNLFSGPPPALLLGWSNLSILPLIYSLFHRHSAISGFISISCPRGSIVLILGNYPISQIYSISIIADNVIKDIIPMN